MHTHGIWIDPRLTLKLTHVVTRTDRHGSVEWLACEGDGAPDGLRDDWRDDPNSSELFTREQAEALVDEMTRANAERGGSDIFDCEWVD